MPKSLFTSIILAVQATAFWIPSNLNSNDGGDLDLYARTMLDMHNQDRANHGVQSLLYNDTAAAAASALASNCYYTHNHDGNGQNIAYFTTTDFSTSPIDAAQRAMNGWYADEISNYVNQYGAGSPSDLNIDSYAHFTQIVWASTRSVGCATQRCNGMGNVGFSSGGVSFFTVCDYWPPGNWAGAYDQNVFPPVGRYNW